MSGRKQTHKDKIDKATKALLGMGTPPRNDPKFIQKDLDRKGKGKIEEVVD